MVRIEFETDNAAFGDDVLQREAEIAAILRRLADQIERRRRNGLVRDTNGNSVGRYDTDAYANKP